MRFKIQSYRTLLFILDVYRHDENGKRAVALQDVANRQNISIGKLQNLRSILYARKILKKRLQNVKGHSGAGFVLGRNLEDITLGEVFIACGDLPDFLSFDNPQITNTVESKVIEPFLKAIGPSFLEMMYKITLKDLECAIYSQEEPQERDDPKRKGFRTLI
jgi:DNA-binding IscR family transcriptional regulator